MRPPNTLIKRTYREHPQRDEVGKGGYYSSLLHPSGHRGLRERGVGRSGGGEVVDDPTEEHPVLFGAKQEDGVYWWWVAFYRSPGQTRFPVEYALRSGRTLGSAHSNAGWANKGEPVKEILSNIVGGGQLWDCWWGDLRLHYDLPLDGWGYFISPKANGRQVRPVLDITPRRFKTVKSGPCCLYTNLNGRTTRFLMDQGDMVQALRAKVAEWCDVRPGEIRLQFCAKELEDGKV